MFIEQQVRAQDERAALETVRFLFTDLSRELYFGYDYACGQGSVDSCDCLVFSDQQGRRVKVRRNTTTNRVEQSAKPFDPVLTCEDTDAWVPLTSDSVSVIDFTFNIQEDDGTKQPRVLMTVAASYTLADQSTEKKLQFKTQVTGRIISPNSAILSTFFVDPEADQGSSSVYYFVFGPERGGSGNVCQDNQGNVFCKARCTDPVRPIAAEFTDDGLYVLGSNGLLFFIPEGAVEDALDATGAVGSTEVAYVKSSVIQQQVVRVVGDDGSGDRCFLCANDPRGIVSLHPAGDYLYAVSSNGALFTVDGFLAERHPALMGGISKDTVRDIAIDDDRTLLFYRDSTKNRVLRLFTGSSVISVGDINNSCEEFVYVPGTGSSNRCRQLRPDPDSDNDYIAPKTELEDVLLSALDRLQVISRAGNSGDLQRDLLFLWHRTGGDRKLLAIGNNSGDDKGFFHLRTNDDIAGGGPFVHSRQGGSQRYTSVCKGGEALCSVSDISGSITTLPVNNFTLRDTHVHIRGRPVGVSGSGKLVYFSGFIAGSTAKEIPTYSRDRTPGDTSRVLCGLTVDGDDQVSYLYLSKKHESRDMVALLGESLDTEGGAVVDIYIAEESNAAKDQYGVSADDSDGGELNVVCGSEGPYIERYRLPSTGGPSLDVVRLRGVVLKDTEPANTTEHVDC